MVEKPCKWQLDGMSEPGVYPISPWPRSWFLDQRRDHPVLQVKRWQLPLAPAYSITAHGSQGQTMIAAIIDLEIGRGVSAIASYVSMTRIRTRHDLLIFRNFGRDVFTKGPPEGPTLLLRKLRGEKIDWQAVEDKHTPNRRCHGPCISIRFKDAFSQKEWDNREDRHCKECIDRLKQQGKTHRCFRCRSWCGKEEFTEKSQRHRHSQYYICATCRNRIVMRKCFQCESDKPEDQFPKSRWRKELKERVCLDCGNGRQCSLCPRQGDLKYFDAAEWRKPDTDRRCKDCVPRLCSQCRRPKTKSQFSRNLVIKR